MFRRYTALLLLSILSGCAATARTAVLQNPKTSQTVECKITPMGGVNWSAQVDNCITAYKKAGYVLVADSADEAPTATTPR